MENTQGITLRVHPGTMTPGNLGDLLNLAEVVEQRSIHYAGLLRDWVEQEQSRRLETEDFTEPALLQCNCSAWTDSELITAARVSLISLIASEDSRPIVRKFLGRLSITINGWAHARLTAPKD